MGLTAELILSWKNKFTNSPFMNFLNSGSNENLLHNLTSSHTSVGLENYLKCSNLCNIRSKSEYNKWNSIHMSDWNEPYSSWWNMKLVLYPFLNFFFQNETHSLLVPRLNIKEQKYTALYINAHQCLYRFF